MKTVKPILIAIVLSSIFLMQTKVEAQSIYKANADTLRYTADFYLLSKTNGNEVYYTYDLTQFKTEFENLYFKDFINKAGGINFKTISFNDGVEAIFSIDKNYSSADVLHFFAQARKMTMTENYRFSEIEKIAFVKKAKEPKNN